MTVGGVNSKRDIFQLAEVHKPCLSISNCADMRFDCYLGKKGGFLLDVGSGERIPLERLGNLYIMKLRIRQDPMVSVCHPFAGSC